MHHSTNDPAPPDLDTLAQALDALPQAVLFLDAGGRIHRINTSCQRAHQLGHLLAASSDLVGRSFCEVLTENATDDPSSVRTSRAITQAVQRLLRGEPSGYQHEPHPGTPESDCWYTLTATRLPEGGAIITYTDVTDLHERQAEIAYHASHDVLTGLLNRYAFFERAEQLFALARRHHRPLHLLLLDLDGFKPINDSFGHRAGDYALVQVARRLHATVRESDLVARYGGDEFLVLAESSDPRKLARRLRRAITRPLRISGTPVTLGVSVGCVNCEAGDLETLVRCADARMYAEKRATPARDRRHQSGSDRSLEKLVAGKDETALLDRSSVVSA